MERHVYKAARIARDQHFDGKFYFGVKTTGIFCRPSCPSPTAKEENVVYFKTIYEALSSGFRPCLRCQPDIETDCRMGNAEGSDIVNKALQMIYGGFLMESSVEELSRALHLSSRHLRKLFVDYLGIPPIKLARYHQALFAKRLLIKSDWPVTRIVSASGFKSIRQFNDVFRQVFDMSPTEARKNINHPKTPQTPPALEIHYEKPFDFEQVLEFMSLRAIRGVEKVEAGIFSRTFRLGDASGYFEVCDLPEASKLELRIYSDDIRCFMPIYHRVRRMFDVDANIDAIKAHLSLDRRLQKALRTRPLPRLPVAFNPYEFVVRAVLGQQITVKAATTLAGRIAERAEFRTEETFPEGLECFFPSATEVDKLDLRGLGITATRQKTLKTVTRGLLDGAYRLDLNQSYEDYYSEFTSLKGIGDWTANYVAMRGLGMVDSFPASDLGVIKALETDGKNLSSKEILRIAEPWRPYRAYATLCLWHGYAEKED